MQIWIKWRCGSEQCSLRLRSSLQVRCMVARQTECYGGSSFQRCLDSAACASRVLGMTSAINKIGEHISL